MTLWQSFRLVFGLGLLVVAIGATRAIPDEDHPYAVLWWLAVLIVAATLGLWLVTNAFH